MSLGLRLLAKLSVSSITPEPFMNRIEQWVLERYSELRPKTRQGDVDGAFTVFCQLHPAAEEIELTLIDPEHVVASANTTTVGPGYHIFLSSLLKDWARDFDALWLMPDEWSEEYGDETEFFFTGDERLLRDEMTSWLKAVANMFFDGSLDRDARGIALCMPVSLQFDAAEPAITPLGPRNREWLRKTAQDGIEGRDFFAWWSSGLGAEYYLGRALTQMWSHARWHPPVNDSQREVLTDIDYCLRKAYALDPTLEYPWAEWGEVLDFLGIGIEEKELLQLSTRTTPTIGYRRRNITAALPGGWSMKIPGSFSDFEPDEGYSLCAIDPPREIWFTAYQSNSPGSLEAFESAKKEMKANRPEHLLERDTCIAEATIVAKRDDTGEPYFVLNSSVLGQGRRAVCTIVFPQSEQKEWALETWRSVQPPSPEES